MPCQAADQNHVFSRIHELATMKLAHEGFVDLARGEGEAGQVPIGREARRLHVTGPSRRHALHALAG